MNLSTLSQRERDVLSLIVDGQTAKEISRNLGISHRTVESHIGHIFDKTGTNRRTKLAAVAAVQGF